MKKLTSSQSVSWGRVKSMSLKDSEDIYVYLSSLAGGKTYLNNSTTAFENRISTINLDPNRDYEVGLANILFPKYFYCINEGDARSSVSFHGKIHQSEYDTYEYNLYTYVPERNIVSSFGGNSIARVTRVINDQMVRELEVILNESFHEYFPTSEIIYYDEGLERVVVNNNIVNANSGHLYSDISIKFAPHIARILGFSKQFRYTVYFQNFGEVEDAVFSSPEAIRPPPPKPLKLYAQNTSRADGGHDYMYVYCDIVSPSRFGPSNVNILDILPLPGDTSSKGSNPIAYKPLTLSTIQNIAIKITNQRGRPIKFEGGSHSVTCVLHIRPR